MFGFLSIIICLVFSKYTSIINDPYLENTKSFYLRHPTGNRSTYGPVPPNKPSNWSISQWQIPNELKAETMSTKNCKCSSEERNGIPVLSTYNDYARVCICSDQKFSYFNLYQNGNNLKCHSFPPGEEYDLFLEQKENTISKSPYISDISSLKMEFFVQLNDLKIHSLECGNPCSAHNNVTYSSIIPSLIFSTFGSPDPLTLFVQFVLYDTRKEVCKGITDPCDKNSKGHWFTQNHPVYGLNFGISGMRNIDGSVPGCISDLGKEYHYDLEIMNIFKLIDEMKELPPGFTKDWSKWRLSSFYLGNIQEGKIETDILVGGIDIGYISKK